MKKFKSILTTVLALVLCLALVGCGQTDTPAGSTELTQGGVLCLKVNPEIAVSYDADGKVTGVESRNADAAKLLESYTDFEGKATREVVTELVNLIGEAGYFVEEVEGESRKITIEIEVGSKLPSDTFLDDVIADVKASIDAHDWTSPINVTGDIYELPDYVDTDYGPNNDGVTDYDDTDYGPNSDGVTDYDDTDYGPNSDGVTDYDDTDYGPNSDGVTDYDDTDYGPNSDGVTDYDDTDYGPNNDGVTDYDDTDYGPDNDGVTDYDDGDTNYDDDGKTDYDD